MKFLSERAVNKLIREKKLVKDEKLTLSFQERAKRFSKKTECYFIPESDSYLKVDEHISSKSGLLFSSLEEIDNFISELDELSESIKKGIIFKHDCSEERFPYKYDFIEKIPALLNSLASRFFKKNSSKDLEFSKIEMDLLTKKLRRLGKTRCQKSDIFPLVIAYLGEYVRCHREGVEWRMCEEDDYNGGTVYYPYLVSPDGTEWHMVHGFSSMLVDKPLDLRFAFRHEK